MTHLPVAYTVGLRTSVLMLETATMGETRWIVVLRKMVILRWTLEVHKGAVHGIALIEMSRIPQQRALGKTLVSTRSNVHIGQFTLYDCRPV